MKPLTSSPMRVLVRPAAGAAATTSSSSSSTAPSIPPLSPNPTSLRLSAISSSRSSLSSSATGSCSSTAAPPDGVIVVGLIGGKTNDVTQLINRILDANVFGSGNLDKELSSSSQRFAELDAGREKRDKNGFAGFRRMSYYHEQEKGTVFLQFSSSRSSVMEGTPLNEDGCRDLSLNSVLEDFESEDMKGMLFMFSVCHIVLYLHEGSRFDTQILKKLRTLQAAKHAMAPFLKSHLTPTSITKASSSTSQPTVHPLTSNSPPPSRSGSVVSRHASAISLMSGSSSHPTLFPGQCTPIILFVFLDDFSDSSNVIPRVEDLADTSLGNQSSSTTGIPKTMLSTKGSSSFVMLARPVSKSESSLRKKLQSSLEAQIRFLIKKCRILAGTESNHSVSRGVVHVGCPPLFSLDASRVVALLDRSMNSKDEPLNFASALVEGVLQNNAASDILLFDKQNQNLNKDDIQPIKEFIYRQSETFRGRGGLATNTNSGSVAGVGMVAVAAAAAAASAASGKSFNAPPELPSLEDWISYSHLFLNLLMLRHDLLDGNNKLKNLHITGKDAIESAKHLLESGRGLNVKFSQSWCRKALPTAKDIYLKSLPACYPTVVHEAQLDKALQAFWSMVKGPAVHVFTERLKEECTAIWKSGRQLCDAVSLTGKSCVHQKHDAGTTDLDVKDVRPHSSGYVFLHACACGRLRQFRDDPFDFESANVKFNCFPNCENLLASLQLPKSNNGGPVQASWSLVRIGGAKYYEPSKGLLLSGFCSNEKFLSCWRIVLEKQEDANSLQVGIIQKGSKMKLNPESSPLLTTDDDTNEAQTGVKNQGKPSENVPSDDTKISFGRGLPLSALKKPFAEVVAGSLASDSAFPPLQQRRQLMHGSEKGNKLRVSRDRVEEKVNGIESNQESQVTQDISTKENHDDLQSNVDPFLQIGNNVIPMTVSGSGNHKSETSLKHVVVYVGFEHECPHGHRFLLSQAHLNGLDSLYALPKAHRIPSKENFDRKPANFPKSSLHEKTFQKEINHCTQSKYLEELEGKLQPFGLDDGGGSAFLLLNRNLPVYMNCPHCRSSKIKEEPSKPKFASCISQLQRIFMDLCLPPTVRDRDRQSRFSLGCRVILPPESFLTLRLPFVYGVELEDGTLHPLKQIEHKPEVTAWIAKGTTLQIVSKESNARDDVYL